LIFTRRVHLQFGISAAFRLDEVAAGFIAALTSASDTPKRSRLGAASNRQPTVSQALRSGHEVVGRRALLAS
jgi:hypothetical protein